MFSAANQIILSALVPLIQGAFAPMKSDENLRVWSTACSKMLIDNNENELVINVPPRLSSLLTKALELSFVELLSIKETLVLEFPPDRSEYIFVGSPPAALHALFAADPSLRAQSYHLPVSFIGFGDEDFPTLAETQELFVEVLKKMDFHRSNGRAPVFVLYSVDGYDVRDVDKILREMPDEYWHQSHLAILQAKLPTNQIGQAVKPELKYSLVRVSGLMNALMRYRVLDSFAQRSSRNFSVWKYDFEHRFPVEHAVNPSFTKLVEDTEIMLQRKK